MDQKEIAEFQHQAEEAFRRGLSLREEPDRAEQALLQALKTYDRLWGLTEDRNFAQAAGEVCQYLADYCMQQGNMHGADVYYVKAMQYSVGNNCG